MTDNEILLLITGVGIGAQGMAVWHMGLDMRAARRDLARSRQARRRAAGDQLMSSFRLYRLQQRTGVQR